MVVNFTLTQFVPGGPIEQLAAQVQGSGDAFSNISGAGAGADTGVVEGV
jgi:microcin C transport system permease protein